MKHISYGRRAEEYTKQKFVILKIFDKQGPFMASFVSM